MKLNTLELFPVYVLNKKFNRLWKEVDNVDSDLSTGTSLRVYRARGGKLDKSWFKNFISRLRFATHDINSISDYRCVQTDDRSPFASFVFPR